MDICNILKNFQIQCDGYEVDTDYFKKNIMQQPVIAQVRKKDSFHFVLILESDTKHIKISDPAIGIYKDSIENFNLNFNHILLVPEKHEDFKITKTKDASNWQEIINIVPKMSILYLVIFTLIASSFEFATGYYLKFIVDSAIPNKDVDYLLSVTFLILLYTILIFFITHFRNKISFLISQNCSEQIFSIFVNKTLSQNYIFFNNKKIGDFSTRLSDIYEIANNIVFLSINVIMNIILITAFGILLGLSNLLFLGFFLVYLIIYCVISANFNKKYKIAYNNSREQLAYFENVYIKSISAIFSIKTFSYNDGTKFFLKNEFKNNNQNLKSVFNIQNIEMNILSVLQALFQIIIMMWAAIYIINGDLTLGSFVFLITIVQYISSSFNAITQIQPAYQKLKVSVNRIFSFTDNNMDLDIDYIGDYIDPANTKFSNIIFDRITFSINENVILSNFSMKLNFEDSKIIGIRGESGVGKSTLMRSMLKLYPISSGEIFIDNIPIEKLSRDYLRKHIVLLNQSPEFIPSYAQTIDQNIFDRFKMLLELFGLEKELSINSLASINYILSNEDSVSGGQKQRLYICLALIANPKIIILDESLSGLNQEWIDVLFSYLVENNISAIIISHDENILSKTDSKIKVISPNE